MQFFTYMQSEDIARLESDNEMLQERLRGQPPQTFQALKRADIVIKGVLDRGGWGQVSVGKYHGCKVAIKQPHEWIMHETLVTRMKREATNMAKMHHPNLVTFIGAIFDDKSPIIVVELMDANLRVTYEKTTLTKDQMLSIFKDVAYALHHLHEFREPIIHRDLSAPNVLLKFLPGNRYTAKVGDFGSSNIARLASTRAEGAIIYSAPESFPSMDENEPAPQKQTVKMDSYSYGVLLCEVFNRKMPDTDSRKAMMEAMAGKWRSMHGLVLRCVKHDATQRPTMVEILHLLRQQ
jgi:serine/threonine protein kinase